MEDEHDKPDIIVNENKEDHNILTASTKGRAYLLFEKEFYKQEGWFDEMIEILFKIKARNTTVKAEVYHGVNHFISCIYHLVVVPHQLSLAGYNNQHTTVAIALCSGFGSIICGLFSNLPFVVSNPTIVSIYLSVYLRQNDFGPRTGSYATILSGFVLLLFVYRPFGDFVRRLIPLSIQVGTTVGIGLLIALCGGADVNFVQQGEYTILEPGKITPEVCITFASVMIIILAMRFHIPGAFAISILFGSIIYWLYDKSFPIDIVAIPDLTTINFNGYHEANVKEIVLVVFDIVFLSVLYLNGMISALGNLAILIKEDGTVPRVRWIYTVCGILTIISGCFTSSAVLVSPESAAAIKEGAKTGLSTVVCGFIFLLSSFFAPLFAKIPACGYSPCLIMIGAIVFQNVNRLDWRNIGENAPAYLIAAFIPFSYSAIRGITLGYLAYMVLHFFTGELLQDFLYMLVLYIPSCEVYLMKSSFLSTFLLTTNETQQESDEMNNNIQNKSINSNHDNRHSIETYRTNDTTASRDTDIDFNFATCYNNNEHYSNKRASLLLAASNNPLRSTNKETNSNSNNIVNNNIDNATTTTATTNGKLNPQHYNNPSFNELEARKSRNPKVIKSDVDDVNEVEMN